MTIFNPNPGSPRGSISWGEVRQVLTVAFWFGLVAGLTHAIELFGNYDFGSYKPIYDTIAAGLLWLIKKWASDSTVKGRPQLVKQAGKTS